MEPLKSLGSNSPKTTHPETEQLSLFDQDAKVSNPLSSRKRWMWLMMLLLIAGGGLTVWRVFSPVAKPQPAIAQSPTGPPPRAVEVTALQSGRAESRINLIGQVETNQRSVIRSQTRGVVERILVQPGDLVTQGMVIATLDDADQQLSVAEAQARLAQQRSSLARVEVGTRPEIIEQRKASLSAAQARERSAQDNLQRTRDLVKEGAVTQRLLVEAQAALDTARGQRLQAEAEFSEAQAGPIREEIQAQRANVAAAAAALNQARLAQQRTQVVASVSGTVQTRQVSQGDLVESGNELITLIGGDRLDIFLEVPENLSGQVQPGTPVELNARALPQWKQRATITAMVPSADTASRRQRVRVELDNPPQGLLPGMAVEAVLSQPVNRPSFVVSRDVLTQQQNKWFVFAIADNRAKPIEVEMVADMGAKVAIFSPNLQAGQTIVARGGDGLQEGMNVKVVQQ